MKLIMKLIWFRLERYWSKQWKERYLRAVCYFTDHEWVNDGHWAATARKCVKCSLREKGKSA